MKTKVGMYYSNNDVRVEEIEISDLDSKEVLIKVMASGICGTDIMEWYRKRKAPMVQGHEIAGKIIEVGKDIKDYSVGDRVFATHHVPCGECRDCERDYETQCHDFQKVNNFEPGGFSEYVKVFGKSVEKGIIKIPDGVTYDQASFVEPLGTVTETVKIRKKDTVIVLGSGIAGILNIQYVKLFGANKIIATDINTKKLDYALKFGADYAILADDYNPKVLKNLNDGRLADLVIVCAAAKSAMEQALESFGNGGRVTIFATPKEGEKVGIDFFKLWRTGFTWHPTYGASPLACQKALDLIRNKKINVEDMITHRLSLEKIEQGFQLASKGQGLKIIIKPHGKE